MIERTRLAATRVTLAGVMLLAGVSAAVSAVEEGSSQPQLRSGWAYRKLERPAPPRPARQEWTRNPIDAFILARLEQAGLEPAPEADRLALIRRATYDLTGLPPSPAEVREFLSDESGGAYENLIERLLNSPHYGEKWGRHWLDLARFAETNGYERDSDKPDAWRYRDYVIRAFNEDKPYDRFLIEQLAGDELSPPTRDSIIATGFYRLGILDDEPADRAQALFDGFDDVLSTTASVMLGMSLGCARCHDHKRDPIPQTDYYRMLAFMRNINPNTKNGASVQTAIGGNDLALSVTERPGAPPDTFVLMRGSPHAPGPKVIPGFPAVLGFDDPDFSGGPKGTPARRRTVLARWIASEDNPLTARVMMNRVWQFHFGRGIVPTPNDFGKLGLPPTHPKLLDWLAAEFIAQDWKLKVMHRLIMTSSTYRMSSKENALSLSKDPANDLLGRFNMRRLTAEEIRDSILAVNGTLNLALYGPSVYPPVPKEVLATSSRPGTAWGNSSAADAARRSIYIKVKRSLTPPMLATHDVADTDSSCAVRFTTTVPTQALTLLNSEFMQAQAGLLAKLLGERSPDTRSGQIRLGLELVTQRPALEPEVERGMDFLDHLEKQGVSAPKALEHFCLLALNLNEFVYLD